MLEFRRRCWNRCSSSSAKSNAHGIAREVGLGWAGSTLLIALTGWGPEAIERAGGRLAFTSISLTRGPGRAAYRARTVINVALIAYQARGILFSLDCRPMSDGDGLQVSELHLSGRKVGHRLVIHLLSRRCNVPDVLTTQQY